MNELFAIMREDHSARPLAAPAHARPEGSDPWAGAMDDNFTLWAKPQHFDIGILEHMARQFPVSGGGECLHRRRVHNVRTALAMVNLVRAGIGWPEDLDETTNPEAHDAAADAMVTATVMRDAFKEIEGFTKLLNVVRASMEKHAALPPVVLQATTPRVLQSADEAPCGSLCQTINGEAHAQPPRMEYECAGSGTCGGLVLAAGVQWTGWRLPCPPHRRGPD
jgi:hypothetical protein